MKDYTEAIEILEGLSDTELKTIAVWIKDRLKTRETRAERVKEVGQIVTAAMERALGEPMQYKSRIRIFYDARLIMANWLYNHYLTLAEVGSIIHKDYSTVHWILGKTYLIKQCPETKELNEKFLKEIENENVSTQKSSRS